MARHQKPGTVRFDLDISAVAHARFASIHQALGFKTKVETFEAIVFSISIKDLVDPNAIGRIETKIGHVLEVLESIA
jgi:hypothetical protein